MDQEEKKRLRKLGKQIVEKRAQELREQLARGNPAPVGSDEHLRNEIAIRHRERALREEPRVHSAAEVRRDFIVRPMDLDRNETYPESYDNYWECRACGDFLPTSTRKVLQCSCGNLLFDGRRREFYVRDEGVLRLVRLLGKATGSERDAKSGRNPRERMGIFRRFFGGKSDKDRSRPGPNVRVALPYETLTVPGVEAVSTCLRLRAEGAGRFTPVMVGDPKNLSVLLHDVQAQGDSPQTIIDRSAGISMQSFLDQRLALDEESYRRVARGEWPQDATPFWNLTGPLDGDIVHLPFLESVAICKVPTPRSWEVPAYFSFGAWHDCPTPDEHVALLRYWHEQYGADIITLSSHRIECTVSRPPTEREQALALAWEHFVYCPGTVFQDMQTLSALAAGLRGGEIWLFWWD